MIVSKKILIAVAVIPVIIAISVAIPRISPGADQVPATTTVSASSQISIQFVKEDMRRVSFGVTENIGSEKREILIINSDGSALYNLDAEGGKGSQTRFKVDSVDLKRIKALVAETGFMQLPMERFTLKDDAQEFKRFTITVNVDSQTKRIQWFNESATEDFVPPLLLRIEAMLLSVMEGGK